MVRLICMIVGLRSGFVVDINTSQTVDHLKKAIKAKFPTRLKDIDADKLHLFQAKMMDDKWLSVTSEDVLKLEEGQKTPLVQALIREDLELQGGYSIAELLANMETPKPGQIHVLVSQSIIRVGEDKHDAAVMDELTHYQKRGELIQRNCKDYCQQILDKIDKRYASRFPPLPFICVEGSSGMGKSQLAFALGGNRPWFYWPTAPIDKDSQLLYRNFSSISKAFRDVTLMDDPMNKSEYDILSSMSLVYTSESLWTYGFIRALLEYCSEEQNQHGQMVRFRENTSLHVYKCEQEMVIDLCENMIAEGKVLPFFVLDEMTPDVQEKNLAAFQRNVFRACCLVVVVMGSDAKITQLFRQPRVGRYAGVIKLTTLISTFTPYQPLPFADEDKQTTWNCLQDQYPVLNRVVANSRGRFARYFVESAVRYALTNFAHGIKLCDLLDVAFGDVSLETQRGKPFMGRQEGKDAQLMAISYCVARTGDRSLPLVGRKKVGSDMEARCMHVHFANLVDHQLTDIEFCHSLLTQGKAWYPRCCFPAIKEDLLLYLAVLGGKTYSGYYDHEQHMDHSTLSIFLSYLKGKKVTIKEDWYEMSNNVETFQNMVAHMLFCASRRNGVQGISFDDFFTGLLGECREQIQPVTMRIGNAKNTIVASHLLDKYTDLVDLSCSKIPFLAPPNAEWPQWILDTRGDGCNFGHIVRNDERCNVYVCNMKDLSKPPLLLCECKYWDKSVDFGVIDNIVCGLESDEKGNWSVALVFCVSVAAFQNKWDHKSVGCVKVDCRNCRVDWVFQPVEENRKKLVIAMEMGSLAVEMHDSFYQSSTWQ